MKNIFKQKFIPLIIALALVLGVIPLFPAFQAQASVIQSGNLAGVGGAPWRLYADGTLVVEAGRIDHTGTTASPWISHNANITNIVFEAPATGVRMRALFMGLTNVQTITGLENIDTSNVTSFDSMFRDMVSLTTISDVSGWNTSSVTSMGQMFRYARNLTAVDVGNWETGNVTNMGSMFRENISLTTLDVSGWDTSNVRIMDSMFRGNFSTNMPMALTSLDVSGWDTSNVTSMAHMFVNASSLTALDVSNWDTSNVTNTQYMFHNAIALTTLEVSDWNTSNVTNMGSMFSAAHAAPPIPMALTSLDVSGWDTGNVTSMRQMFMHASNLTELDVSNWDTSNVTLMQAMFRNVSSVSELDVSGWNTEQVTRMDNLFRDVNVSVLDVSGWDTSSATTMSNMFDGASNVSVLNVTNWDTGSVTSMVSMFLGARSLTTLDVSNWNTSNVTNMGNMFRYNHNLTALDVSGWDTSNVTSMANMFRAAVSLTELDVGGWDTSRVTDMQGMFRGIPASNSAVPPIPVSIPMNITTLDVSNWDTGRVTNMNNMFSLMSNVEELDVSDWNTVSVTNMGNMFEHVSSVEILDVSDWNTSNVTNMISLFMGVRNVEILDVSGWNTSNVANMGNMFRYANSVTELNVSRWDTSNVTTMAQMFLDTYNLADLDVSGWDTSRVTSMTAMFRNARSLTTLDVSGWDTSAVRIGMANMFNGASNLTSLDLSGWDTRLVTAKGSMFAGTTSLSRIHFGENFENTTTTNPALPRRGANTEYTGLWLNITPPGGLPAITSGGLVGASGSTPDPNGSGLLPTGGGGPFAPGIWVWEREVGIVMLTVDGVYRFPTVAVGYAPVTPLTVAVANAGRTVIQVPLDVTLSGPNADDFELIINTDNLPPSGQIPIGSSWANAFTVVPRHGLSAGTYAATVTVSGVGINTETFDVSFTVLPNSIENAVITFADAVFNGNQQQPAMTVTLNGEVLVEGVDFEVVPNSWTNNIRAGNPDSANPPSVIIRGINNFNTPNSEATGEFTIRPRPITVTAPSAFRVQKVYDGTNSSEGATHTGNLTLSGLLATDNTRVRIEWTSIGDFSGVNVDDHETSLFGLHLVSTNPAYPDWHLNYDLDVAMLGGITARITPAVFSPILIVRTVMAGASRTISIPLSELTPGLSEPRQLGQVYEIDLHNFSAGPISVSATMSGAYLVITTDADKTLLCEEIITVRFQTQNFGNVDVRVELITTEGIPFVISYAFDGYVPAGAPAVPSSRNIVVGTPNISATTITPATVSGVNTYNVPGNWTFSGWSAYNIATPNAFTMPDADVAFTGSWTFSTNATHTISYSFGTGDGVPTGVTVPTDRNVVAGIENVSATNVASPVAGVHNDVPGNWTFSGWSAYNIATPNAFTMPDENVEFIGSWTFSTNATHTISYSFSGGDGVPTGITAPTDRNVVAGIENVSATAVTSPVTGTRNGVAGTWTFSGWTATNVDTPNSFTMPDADVAFSGSWTFTANVGGGGSGGGNIGGGNVGGGDDDVGGGNNAGDEEECDEDYCDCDDEEEYGNNAGGSRPGGSGGNYGGFAGPGPGGTYMYLWDVQVPLRSWDGVHLAYLVGFADGTIRPREEITRAQIATIIFRLMNFSERESYWHQDNPFADVMRNHWHNNAVSTTWNADVFTGMPDGTFMPDRAITRAEMAATIVRFKDVNPYDGSAQFNDISGHWAQGYINTAAHMGWVRGDSGIGGTFRPDSTMTRAETAAMINRAFGRLVEDMQDLYYGRHTWSDNANPNTWYYLYIQEASNSNFFANREDEIHKYWIGLFVPEVDWTRLERPDSQPGDIFRMRDNAGS